ncbi:MAG: alpha/beta fold hydrolase [Thermoanaerobaculaceae bacterium]
MPVGIEPIQVTYPPADELGYPQLLEVVLAALPTKPYVLLGESFSGPLAVMAAARRPGGLRGMILCATFIRCPIPLVPRWAAGLVRAPVFRLYPAVGYLRFLLGKSSSAALRTLAAEALRPVRPRVLACRVREVVRVDVAGLLSACAVPVLYIRGLQDWVVPRSAMRAVLQAAPSAELALLPGPHMVLQTNPVAAADAITGFTGRIGAV